MKLIKTNQITLSKFIYFDAYNEYNYLHIRGCKYYKIHYEELVEETSLTTLESDSAEEQGSVSLISSVVTK